MFVHDIEPILYLSNRKKKYTFENDVFATHQIYPNTEKFLIFPRLFLSFTQNKTIKQRTKWVHNVV